MIRSLVLALLAAALVLPAAHAFAPVCAESQCLYGGSTSYSDCDGFGDGYQYNSLGFYGHTDVTGYTSASAGTACWDYSAYDYHGSSLGASASTYGGMAGYNYVVAGWWWYEFFGNEYCDTYAQGHSSVTNNDYGQGFGCPVGNPPDVPAVLP